MCRQTCTRANALLALDNIIGVFVCVMFRQGKAPQVAVFRPLFIFRTLPRAWTNPYRTIQVKLPGPCGLLSHGSKALLGGFKVQHGTCLGSERLPATQDLQNRLQHYNIDVVTKKTQERTTTNTRTSSCNCLLITHSRTA